MKRAEYISRKVLDRYFDKFTRKLVRLNTRIMEIENAWARLNDHLVQVDTRLQVAEARITGLEGAEE